MTPKLDRSDFILSLNGLMGSSEPEESFNFGDYSFISREPYSHSESASKKCIVIGQVYSSAHPEWTRLEIANYIIEGENLSVCIENTKRLSGRFVIILSINNEIYIVGDAMCQFEVFYHKDCSTIASSLFLIDALKPLSHHSGSARELYNSIEKTSRIQIGQTTAFADAFSLMPNHYLDLKAKKQFRFYPNSNELSQKITLREGAKVIANEMRNFAESISKTPNLIMPVTGGNDSRILLGAFKKKEFRTFIFNHPNSNRADRDIKSGQVITAIQGRKFEVINYSPRISPAKKAFLDQLNTLPRKELLTYLSMGFYEHLEGSTILLGHGGEIGRSFFKNIKRLNAEKMAFLMDRPNHPFVLREMQKWLDELDPAIRKSENLIDLFYWEQRMGNWGARILTEISYGVDIFSPMNARSVLSTMLLVPKKHRQFTANDLVKELILTLDKSLLTNRINSSLKYHIIEFMIKMKIYNLYQNLRLSYLVKKAKRTS